MPDSKLYIVMVGLPARGKSTIATKLKDNLSKDAIKTRIFNNGNLRRQMLRGNTSVPEFYDPENDEGVALREKIAELNLNRAKKFISRQGQVAIIDATNGRQARRDKINRILDGAPILYIECINDDAEILEASILRKTYLSEFRKLSREQAIASFKRRINYYQSRYVPLKRERNFIKLDSLNNKVKQEEVNDNVPYYDRIRDFLVTDSVKNLFLIRHGETFFNQENRIGGDSPLTEKGKYQAARLGRHFANRKIPVIFTSDKVRTIQTAEPIRAAQKESMIISLEEFNEIDSGVCEGMSYEEIKNTMPEVYRQRKKDKYQYVYPRGEGYVSMRERTDRGIKKALYLSSNSNNIMIVGHRAANRMILSHFLYRRTEDVPYIYIPQDKYYHIVAVQDKKLFQLKGF